MSLHVLTRGLSLFSFSLVQLLYPLARTLILARILSSFEFGLTSALSASYSTFELISDIAVHRYVLATKRVEYERALAGAHALSLVRGAAAGLVACSTGPVLAYAMGVPAEWTSFALLGLAIFIRSFEHFEMRVAERDYRYHGQLLINLIANSTALAVMIGTWLYVQDHRIYLAMLFAQNVCYVLGSHLFARSSYRVDFRSDHFRGAVRFALPIVLSGVGLAIVGQGDRLLVGTVLDVPTLGVYSVFILAITVPASAVTQISSSLALAGLHNAIGDPTRTQHRLRLYSRVMLIVAVCFAFGLIACMNIVIPTIFGARFTAGRDVVVLLAAIVFFSVARAEPATSVLLVNHRTRALAWLSLSGAVGLLAAVIFVVASPNLTSVLQGRLIGEIFGFIVTMAILQAYLGGDGWRCFGASMWAAAWVLVAISFEMFTSLDDNSIARLGIVAGLALAALAGLTVDARSLVRRAYPSETIEGPIMQDKIENDIHS